jgi:hypothetical protein
MNYQDEGELSFEEASYQSLAGAHEYQAECEYKASKEHQEYLNILASGE